MTENPAQLRLDQTSETLNWPDSEVAALVEALLLVAPQAPTIDELTAVTGVSRQRLETALSLLDLAAEERGWILQRHGEHLYLASAPRFASQVSSFLGLDREGKLSPAALETLAIIAYHQPVTRSEIESIRGVDSSGVIATLHGRDLVEPVARLAVVGNPFQYGTTVGFLKLFGLASLANLPPIGSVAGDDGAAILGAAIDAAREHLTASVVESSGRSGAAIKEDE